MSMLEQQFNELNALYLSHVTKLKPTEDDRVNFINSAFNKINLISKIISMAANGIKVEDQISIQSEAQNNDKTQHKVSKEEKENITKNITRTEKLLETLKPIIESDQANKSKEKLAEEEKQKEERVLEVERTIDEFADCTIEEIFKKEFESWGINTSYAGCNNIMMLINLCKKDKDIVANGDIVYILNSLAYECCITLRQLNKNLEFIISKANFSNSKFIPVLGKIKKVTVEMLLKEFIEFCVE